ncbi:hypothetical protein M8J77_014147 [Diaphorina citri]|nr:hypothetical protein M8J77_014147 [Diaphorina citri]
MTRSRIFVHFQFSGKDSLLSLVACSCKKGCSKNCGCRSVGLFCSKLCANCEGNINKATPAVTEEEDPFAEDEELELVTLVHNAAAVPMSTVPRPGPSDDLEPGPSKKKKREKQLDSWLGL